jgi:hypothetical protein
MPAVPRDQIGVALDMHGCPNRCRHCWLGRPARRRVTEDDLRWVAHEFRTFKRPGKAGPFWKKVEVSTWFREPDYSSDYRRLYELENELGDSPPPRARYELLSVWRLARDPEYAEWAHSIGLRACQLSFFGLEKTTDWAHRRRGAFRDLLTATERLLAAGIRPRWQVFFTKRLLPDLEDLIILTRMKRLRERCQALGGQFQLFMHCPSPEGEGFRLEHLRPTLDDLDRVPTWLLDQSEEHGGYRIGRPESELMHEMLEQQRPSRAGLHETFPNGPWLYVTASFDVYCGCFEIAPAWRLGNLKADGLAAILDTLESDRAPGLEATFEVPVSELAMRFGRPRGRRLYTPGDLKARWAKMWADQASTQGRTSR